VLGFKWARLAFDEAGVGRAFNAEVVEPIRALAGTTIDEASIIGGTFLPGSIGDKVADAYRKYLFGDATLQDLPPDPPRFVINHECAERRPVAILSTIYRGLPRGYREQPHD
jgi:NTE family protein